MQKNTKIRLCGASELNLSKTFECGQCFRWRPTADGKYLGVAGKYAAVVYEASGGVYLEGQGDESFWRRYFDLERSYDDAHSSITSLGGYLSRCAEYGKGLRILRQEPWEALCSFIFSQCNNIPRIMKIIETFCAEFGEPIDFMDETLFSFPASGSVAGLDTARLSVLRCGYRAPYVLAAAKAVSEGGLDLSALSGLEREAAIAELMKLPGVGRKVASCAALYGLHIMSGFPVDTWMKKALREHFPPGFDPACFGNFAGLAQQYIFYYTREGGA